MLPRKAGAAILISGLLGVVFPMCECGVVPVIRRLMKKGLPISCAVTYLLASPVVNPIVAASTYRGVSRPAAGPDASCWRLMLSYLVAAMVGLSSTRCDPNNSFDPRVLETLPGRRAPHGRVPHGSAGR